MWTQHDLWPPKWRFCVWLTTQLTITSLGTVLPLIIFLQSYPNHVILAWMGLHWCSNPSPSNTEGLYEMLRDVTKYQYFEQLIHSYHKKCFLVLWMFYFLLLTLLCSVEQKWPHIVTVASLSALLQADKLRLSTGSPTRWRISMGRAALALEPTAATLKQARRWHSWSKRTTLPLFAWQNPATCNIVKRNGFRLQKDNIDFNFKLLDQGLHGVEKGSGSFQNISQIVCQMAIALSHLSYMGIVHLDLEPNTAMVLDHGKQPQH